MGDPERVRLPPVRRRGVGPTAKAGTETTKSGRTKLNVNKLGALGEPKPLAHLRGRAEKMLPNESVRDSG
ncbi:hypothetical protein [Streptomyces sp. NPDC015350]|uniref:hypothetical protein n=1 Tax=Streptomyces sp. NPDC015350 TaxID=3364955 RepID=UPI0036FFA582